MTDLVAIFCEIDDFCKEFEKQIDKRLLSAGRMIRRRAFTMSMSEIMTISIYYHFSGYYTFKDYYIKHVQQYMSSDFRLVSYSRFIELRQHIIMPMVVFLMTQKEGLCTGISYIDSMSIKACHIKREYSHKTLKSIARKGKTSMGWFYGTKVHFIINHQGEIVSFVLSSGNYADNNEQILCKLTKKITGKLFGDKGYLIKQSLREKLCKRGIELITKIRSNMENALLKISDKLLLQKRGIIESVGDILKNHLLIEHTRHRAPWAFFLHIFTSITAYQMRPNKPSIASSLRQKISFA